MNYPEQLSYTTGHQWVSLEAQYAFVGITDFGQRELAHIVAVDIPYLNKTLERNRFLGSIEAAHAVLDLFMPFSGVITEINPDMLKYPGLINRDPYDTWIIKILVPLIDNGNLLLTADEYQALVSQ
ncbi:glycine cleavage system protein H [Mucilaginibacter sp.]|jgi:glycine cleavage system H protein|uniref:glycine cleavage system protein H n=1 Tax=Mucilaginibacter sp. TaxID=1882438 RepID=UPI0035671E65